MTDPKLRCCEAWSLKIKIHVLCADHPQPSWLHVNINSKHLQNFSLNCTAVINKRANMINTVIKHSFHVHLLMFLWHSFVSSIHKTRSLDGIQCIIHIRMTGDMFMGTDCTWHSHWLVPHGQTFIFFWAEVCYLIQHLQADFCAHYPSWKSLHL